MNNKTETLIKNGKYVEYHSDGSIDSEYYYLDGKLHRDPSNGPAVIGYYNEWKNR